MEPLHYALWSLLGVALAISVVTDLSRHRILDQVTLPAIALALLLRGILQGPGDLFRGLASGAVGTLVAGGLFLPAAWMGKMGWGDVKLMAAVGACFGYPRVVWGVVFISLVGAAQALVTLAWRKRRRTLARGAIPYGVAIAVGSVGTMLWGG